jgi:hypothetical protein
MKIYEGVTYIQLSDGSTAYGLCAIDLPNGISLPNRESLRTLIRESLGVLAVWFDDEVGDPRFDAKRAHEIAQSN